MTTTLPSKKGDPICFYCRSTIDTKHTIEGIGGYWCKNCSSHQGKFGPFVPMVYLLPE